MVNSSDIDAALLMKLGSDPQLLALCPNGVYMDEAFAGSTRYVIVSLVDHFDEPVFGGRAIEDALYLVEARMLSTAGGDINAAAARIDALLEDQPLTAPGYVWMTTERERRVRYLEDDERDPELLWKRRGGQYRVQFSIIGM